MAHAAEVGSAAAGAEVGVSAATVRKWRARAKAAPAPEPALAEEGASTVEGLRRAAEKARRASARALETADSLLARGLASEGRNASVVAGVFGDRARELEQAAQAAEEHEASLSASQGQSVLSLVERAFGDLGLAMPRAFLQQLLLRWPSEVDPEVVKAARTEVRRSIAGEVRAELIAEAEAARLARPGLPAGETEGDDVPLAEEVVDAEVVEEVEPEAEPDGEPGWNDLPEPWKAKYLTQPRLGIYEYARACKAEEIARRLPRAPVRQRPDFTHPGLRGLGGP